MDGPGHSFLSFSINEQAAGSADLELIGRTGRYQRLSSWGLALLKRSLSSQDTPTIIYSPRFALLPFSYIYKLLGWRGSLPGVFLQHVKLCWFQHNSWWKKQYGLLYYLLSYCYQWIFSNAYTMYDK